MRYQDWDVLLFPGDSQTPIQEFRTNCYALQDPHTHLTTPLLCSFVPSLPAQAPFQVSVHAWDKAPWILGAGNAGYVPGTNYVWQLKVFSDGEVLHVKEYPEDTAWPVKISAANAFTADGKPSVLSFPPFRQETTSQVQWYAAEDRGRIKVLVCAGYNVESSGKSHFVKLIDHVVFSFQPAPMDLLQRSSIAWPNASMTIVIGPMQQGSGVHGPAGSRGSVSISHKRRQSAAGRPEWHEGSSRSTSAYTSYPTYPPLGHFPPSFAPPYPAAHLLASNPRVDVRMHSDQLRQIIEALSPSKRAAAVTVASETSMPPPPLPHHATNPQTKRTASSPSITPAKRAESRYSDVSMHTGCESFPTCTTEDAEGRIVHDSPSTALPAKSIKGRKEGSSPIKSSGRDFMSTVMDQAGVAISSSSPAEDGSARKRTRSALKSLTIGDGSPEKREKPRKKVSRASSANETDKENVMVE